MNFLWGFVTGIVVSTIVCLVWQKMCKTEKSIQAEELESVNFNPNIEVKKENMVKLLELITKQGKVTNDEVQNFLNVSDATAERYLNELEHDGKIKQVGGVAKNTYYEKI